MMKMQRRITKDYFQIACLQYEPLISKLAFQVSVDDLQVEEMKSRSKDELLKCLICYNRSGLCSFMTFLHSRLHGIFRHMRDKERKVKRMQVSSLDSIKKMAGLDCDMDSSMVVQEYLECLEENEREIIVGLFFDGKTMRELSGHLGAASTICRIKTRAIDKMRRKYRVGRE